jgi:hypothetical protein
VGLRSRKNALAYYDVSLSWKWEKQINPGDKNGHLDTVFIMNNKVFAQYSGFNESDKQFALRMERIDQSATIAAPVITSMQMPQDKAERNQSTLSVLSPNRRLLALALKGNAYSGSNDQRTLLIGLCGDDMQINLRKELSLPEDLLLSTNIRLFLSNDSVLFITGQLRNDRINGIRIFRYDFSSDETKGTLLDMGEKIIVGQQCAYDPINENIVISGLYSNLGTESIGGYFYARLNAASLSLSVSTSSPFSDSFMNQFIGEPKSQDKRELLNYTLSHMMLRQDGGTVLLAECRYNIPFRQHMSVFHKT